MEIWLPAGQVIITAVDCNYDSGKWMLQEVTSKTCILSDSGPAVLICICRVSLNELARQAVNKQHFGFGRARSK